LRVVSDVLQLVFHVYFMCVCALTVNYAKPVITRQPQSHKALRYGNVSMVCEAASNSNSMLTVTWRKDDQV